MNHPVWGGRGDVSSQHVAPITDNAVKRDPASHTAMQGLVIEA